MSRKLIVSPDGSEQIVELDPVEVVALDRTRDTAVALEERRQAHRTTIAGVRPDAPLAAKIRSGATLTTAERDRLLRWLSLQLLGLGD